MDDELTYYWPIVFIIIIIITLFILAFTFHNDSPEPQYAQWSQNEIDECYETNNNTLECYHLCREHGWYESYCTELYDTNKVIADIPCELLNYKYC